MSAESPRSETLHSLQEVWASLPEEKRRWDAQYPWLYYFKRPLSLYLARWLLPLGITANQVTAFSALALAASFIAFCFGYGTGFVVGGILLMVFHLADTVDGNLARIRGETSPAGSFFDNVAGTASPTVYFFIGVGLYLTPDAWGHRLVAAATSKPDAALVGVGLLMLGAWTAIASLLTIILRNLVTLNLRQKAEPERLAASPGMLSSSRGQRIRKVQLNLVDLIGHDFLPLIAALAGIMSIFLIASAAIQTTNLICETVYYCRRAFQLFPPAS